MSDNGVFMLKGRGLEVGSNGPFREGGVTLYEGGIRVPCIVRWPGRLLPGTICREPWISVDVCAMLLQAAGVMMADAPVIDGRDPTPLLAGEAQAGDRTFFFTWAKMAAARRGRYKLLRERPDEPFRLYDLVDDQSETRDVAAEKPGLVAELRNSFEEWMKRVHE
jgi:arylsulfatase A-like enzyme